VRRRTRRTGAGFRSSDLETTAICGVVAYECFAFLLPHASQAVARPSLARHSPVTELGVAEEVVTRAGAGTAASRSPHTAEQLHVAFAAADIGAWERRLPERGLAIERTIDWRPGVRSLYVRDPDRHLVGVATPGVWGAAV
jgi:catechol 2,3-dioxygenase-like lactoylglutathione lyase family enzyme